MTKSILLVAFLFLSANVYAENSLLGTSAGSWTSSNDICGDPYGCKEILKSAKEDAILEVAGLTEERTAL